MAKEEELKKVELKVSVDCCDGCKKKVLKALSIQGVLKIEIHPNLPKVTVVGNVDKEMLVKRLAKFGKVAEVISPPDTNKGRQQQQPQKQQQQQQPQQQEESKKPNSDNRDRNCENLSTKCPEEGEKVEKCLDTSDKITNNANSTTANTTTTTTISAMATTALPHITYTVNPAAVHEAVMQQHGVYPMNWYPRIPNPCAIPMASFVHGAYQTPVAQPYCTSGCCYHQPLSVRSLPPRLTEYFNDDNATGCRVM